jgi:F0F1-type ATP synthase assembly protein I
MNQTKPEKKFTRQYTLNLALAAVAGQVGCVTISIVVVALLAGLWLDSRFNSSPLFLATLLIASVPVTVVIMLRIVRSVIARIKPSSEGKSEHPKEEGIRGKDSKSA